MLQLGLVQDSWHHGGLFVGMHWVWWLVSIGVLGVIVWALWQAAAERREVRRQTLRSLHAEEVLRERFARGEITEEEFQSRLRVLHGAA